MDHVFPRGSSLSGCVIARLEVSVEDGERKGSSNLSAAKVRLENWRESNRARCLSVERAEPDRCIASKSTTKPFHSLGRECLPLSFELADLGRVARMVEG